MQQPTEHFLPLHRRPDATTISVRALLEKVRRGEVRVPHFQRPLRWKRENVRQLLDSILRGYPIGSLLVWKQHGPSDEITVGNAVVKVPEIADAWFVVDGQQRITALAASLLDLHQGADWTWEHYLSTDDQTVHCGAPPAAREGVDVPIRVLGELTRLNRWLRQHHIDDEALIQRIEAVQQTLLDYNIPLYVVETDDERALRGVFARLNSTGARMRADEVFHALLGSARPDDEGVDLSRLQEACDLDGFGAPPRTEILKAVLAMSDVEPTKRSDRLDARDLDRLVSAEAAREALLRTVGFLRESAGIPLYRLIPYPVVFVILSRFFFLFGEALDPSDGNNAVLRELRRWLWRGAAVGVHQRAEVSKMREQVRALRQDDLAGSIRRLRDFVRVEGLPEWSLKNFDQRSARSRIELLALLALEPRDHYGPLQARMLGSGDRIAREIFPVKRGADYGPATRTLIRSAANRVVLDQRDTNLSAWLREACDPCTDQQVLRSHLIDSESHAMLVAGEVDAFLTHRAQRLREHVTRFLHHRAQLDEPPAFPVSFYCDPPDEVDEG